MANIKKISMLLFGMAVVIAIIISSCAKNTTVYIPLTTQVITTPISFSKQIVPIFTKNCALSGCHIAGKQAPDLEVASAYSALINGKFVSTSTPKNSILYERLTGALTPQMPFGAAPNPSNINALVLGWITQGAKNN